MSHHRLLHTLGTAGLIATLLATLHSRTIASDSKDSGAQAQLEFRTFVKTSGGKLVLRLMLQNAGKNRVWINRRLAVEDTSCKPASGEVRIQLLDKRSRELPFTCLQNLPLATPEDYAVLSPGDSFSSEWALGPCFRFEPGEQITVRAYYHDKNPRPPVPPSGTSPIKVRLPAASTNFNVPADYRAEE